jgi:hypothetical protein
MRQAFNVPAPGLRLQRYIRDRSGAQVAEYRLPQCLKLTSLKVRVNV